MPFRFVEERPTARRKVRAHRSHIAGYTGIFKLHPRAHARPERSINTKVLPQYNVVSPGESCWHSDDDVFPVESGWTSENAASPKQHSTAAEPQPPRLSTSDALLPNALNATARITFPDPRDRFCHGQDYQTFQQQRVVSGSSDSFYATGNLQQMTTSTPESWNAADCDASLALIPHAVQYNSHAHKTGAILDMYNAEFCVLPLTMDCSNNPFRVRKSMYENSDFLLHAVMALSTQHLAKKNNDPFLAVETQRHQNQALHIFRQALEHAPAARLLDTLLILLTFEATQTAASAWAVHINGAKQILDGIGVAQLCKDSPRGCSQIAMLVWSDITIAFISRREPRFPSRYLELLDGYDAWDFFALTGCPPELVVYMARLAKLASTYQTVMVLEHVSFGTDAVEQVILQLRAWENPEDASLDEVEHTECDINLRRNKYHCIEAWRHALLLYCYRVFNRPASTRHLRSITHLARVILDHVRCIPESEVMQKQTLLPVFLAAAEAGDESTRSFARHYCRQWGVKARYHMFFTAASLLENIWTDWDAATRQVYWWGVKVGGATDDSTTADEIMLG